MITFTAVFLSALALATGVQLWLAWRQIQHALDHRDRVPEAFRTSIPLADHRKAADYTAAKVRLGTLELLAGAGLLLAWTLGGGLDLVDRLWQSIGAPPFTAGVGVIVSVLAVGFVLELPFSAYRTFALEHRFGFNRTTPAVFWSDAVKQVALVLILGIPIAALTLWFMESSGPWWWLFAWAAWMSFAILMMWAYPRFIAPLFNRFTPLEQGEVRARVEALLARVGFVSGGIFVIDGSRRSGHGNAYFTGLGNQKRIVFFDTLLQSLTAAEVESVLAHELGHFKRHHVLKGLAVMAALSLGALALLGWLSQKAWFYEGLGVAQPSAHAALALLLLLLPLLGFYVQPLLTYFSRRHEYEADDFAAEHSDRGPMVSALVKLYRENASTLTPDPLYSAFYDTHPPAPLRVAHLQSHSSAAQQEVYA
jgi:STE24 endopeptidase